MQEKLHNVIINDHQESLDGQQNLAAPGEIVSVVVPELVFINGSKDVHAPDEDEDGESADELAPLPEVLTSKQGKVARVGQKNHVVIIIDASGSMRSLDVQCNGSAENSTRFEAALRGALSFIEAHASRHAADIFSVIVFSDTAKKICKAASADDAKFAIEDCAFRAQGGTSYLPALKAAAECLMKSPGVGGHIVMLTDGRPADTKVTLDFLQRLVRGDLSHTQLHGIGFGQTVESFVVLQQLVCLGGGGFALSDWSLRSLCDAFSTVSSSITMCKDGTNSVSSWDLLSLGSEQNGCGKQTSKALRSAEFEIPELWTFGKKNVLRFQAERAKFAFDGKEFKKCLWTCSPVDRRTKPFMRGGMRLVYGFNDPDITGNGEGTMVAKLSRFSNQYLHSAEVVESHAKSTAVAQYYAALFNAETKKLANVELPAIIFVACFVYSIAGTLEGAQKDDEPTHFAAERYLPGVFLKYNSNNGYVNQAPVEHNDAVQAFMHFTYEASGGSMIVTDLQGVSRKKEVLLTDPQVLSVGSETGIFGPGDIGMRGAKACLVAHRCGPFCRKMQLKPISTSVIRRLQGHLDKASVTSAVKVPRVGWEHLKETKLSDFSCSTSKGNSESASSWVDVLDS